MQQYHTENETLGDFIFTQACILARKLGLHQAGQGLVLSSDLSAIEAEERHKVFRSLFIRDRYSATASGALSWLPNGSPRGPPPTSMSTVHPQAGAPSNQRHSEYTPHWELAKVQDEIDRLLSSADAPEMRSERRIALGRLQQKLETWTRTYKVPSSTRPNTVNEIALHLAFLGTRIRLLNSDKNASDSSTSAQVLYDARLSCLLVVTSCNHDLNRALTDRLDRLLNKTVFTSPRGGETHSSFTTSSPTSASSPSSAISSPGTDAPQRNGPSTPAPSSSGFGQASVSAPLSLHRLANLFPTTAVFMLARHVLGIGACAKSSKSAPTAAENGAQRQQEINQDISLLEALLFCFSSAPLPAAATARGMVNGNSHGSKFVCIVQGLVDIIRAIVGPNGSGNAIDGDDDGDDDAVYAPEHLLASTSSLRLDASSNALSMPNLGLYSGGISPSHLELASPTTLRSTWAPPQDSISSSGTPLFTTRRSLYEPSIHSTPPTIPDTSFDMSEFLHQMGISRPATWDSDQGQTELQMQQQQQQYAQFVPETKKRRSRKRPRTDGNRHQNEQMRY